MDITAFDFKFKHEGEIINANCQVSKPLGKEQYRIAVTNEKGNAVILIMYKVHTAFFWYPVSDKREALSLAVAEELKKDFYDKIN